MRENALRNKRIAEELTAAIADGQIRPWLQPIVDREKKIIGAEALARWIHPVEGIRFPGDCIPVLEKNGMIADLDRCIWRQACMILAQWKEEGKDLFLSVNISPRDFYLLDVAGELKSMVREYGVEPSKLRLEITESVMMTDDENRMKILRDMQSCGFLIEMDDFGSGYSSLNLLREMPVDVLKIDMVFLRNTADQERERARTIVEDVISMANHLSITSLTEGVETEYQYSKLREMGCQLYQGFYFAEPMPVEEFEQYLSSNNH
jgi:EAL domain-containing protein (putative c-di-GMP-specific phosphodiesterase class I)